MSHLNSEQQTFRRFSLSSGMYRDLERAGYREPTPIQLAAIPPAMLGRDVVGVAQTGTGKTAAFLIPIVERLRAARAASGRETALVLAPTRELAEQIHRTAERLGSGLAGVLIVGGVAYGAQLAALRRQPSIIVATPGRLVDHLEGRSVSLAALRVLVLDEADRMLDMGFRPQLDRILRAVPSTRQTLLFSATLPADLGALAHVHLRDPVRVEVGERALPPSRAAQGVYLVSGADKTPLLLSVIERSSGSVLVFARTKHRTNRLLRSVRSAGHSAQCLHSDRSQSQRREALEGFRGGRYRILVATDIAARGIDIQGIQTVINYDLPHTVEDYVHRVGRTARAGATGHASSFATPEEGAQLRAIERHLGSRLARQAHPPRDAARASD